MACGGGGGDAGSQSSSSSDAALIDEFVHSLDLFLASALAFRSAVDDARDRLRALGDGLVLDRQALEAGRALLLEEALAADGERVVTEREAEDAEGEVLEAEVAVEGAEERVREAERQAKNLFASTELFGFFLDFSETLICCTQVETQKRLAPVGHLANVAGAAGAAALGTFYTLTAEDLP